jgi:hypothetical protein
MYGRSPGQAFDEQHLVDGYAEQSTKNQPPHIFSLYNKFIFCKKPERPE